MSAKEEAPKRCSCVTEQKEKGLVQFAVYSWHSAEDNNHKNQAVAQNLELDRFLTISTCEKAADSREKINIVINTIRPEKEAIEGEVIER